MFAHCNGFRDHFLCVCSCEVKECLRLFDFVQLAHADMAANTSESFVFVLNAAFETQKRKNEKVSQQEGSLESFQSQCLCSEQ